MSIAFVSKVKSIEHKSRVVRGWKDANDREQFETEKIGWFMLLEGGWESLYVGDTPPESLKIGDDVIVTIERLAEHMR